MDNEQLFEILKEGVELGVSDIKLVAGKHPWFKFNREWKEFPLRNKLTSDDTSSFANTLLENNRLRAKLKDEFLEIEFSYKFADVANFRVSITRNLSTIKIVLRVIPLEIRDFASLNLPTSLEEIATNQSGLILVTGKLGNGKSTTIAAMVEHINRNRRVAVVTIEDPVEFFFTDKNSSICHKEIGTDIRSFEDGLRQGLREGLDVLIVGEIRTRKCLDIVLKAAESGILVITTLQSSDSISAIRKILSFYNKDEIVNTKTILSNNLRAIISLRLVGSLRNTIIPIVEILKMGPTIAECLRNETINFAEIREHMAKNRDRGMMLFDDELVGYVRLGLISEDTAKENASSPAEIERLMNYVGNDVHLDSSYDYQA